MKVALRLSAVLLCCMLAGGLSACVDPGAQAKDDLETTLQALVDGSTDQAYLYEPFAGIEEADTASAAENGAATGSRGGEPTAANSGSGPAAGDNSAEAGNSASGDNPAETDNPSAIDDPASSASSNGSASQKIASKCTFEIVVMTVADDGNSAVADVTIISPDMATILSEEAASTSDDPDALVAAALARLDGDFPTTETQLSLDLYRSEDHWMLDPGAELDNALSGGLNQMYFSMGKSIVDSLAAEV